MTQKQGNFYSSFIQHASSVGFQKANRFICLLSGPGLDFDRSNSNRVESINFKNRLRPEHQKRLALTCSSATLPGMRMSTVEFSAEGSTPNTSMPYAKSHGANEVVLEFYCSTDFFERQYISKWMSSIINPRSNFVNFYEDYAKYFKMLIVLLPNDVGDFDRVAQSQGSGIYYTRLHEIYPVEMSDTTVKYEDGNKIQKFLVKFKYKTWEDPATLYAAKLSGPESSIYASETLEDFEKRVAQETRDQRIARGELGVSYGVIPTLDPDPNPEDNPFYRFKKLTKDILKYANPAEIRQLAVEQGIGYLNGILGSDNVETIASGGQLIDVAIKQGGFGGIDTIRGIR